MAKKQIKFLIVTMGPGETAQGAALANYAYSKGEDVVIASRKEINYSFFQNYREKFRFYLTETEVQLIELYNREKPDVLVFCNSKIFRYYPNFLAKAPSSKPVSVSLDSNWLFLKGEVWYSVIEWLDRYFIVFPEKIFNSGLKEYGGNYSIPEEKLARIEPVGFIPSYKKSSPKNKAIIREKYGIVDNEKLIFAYFSGFGAEYKPWALEHLINATEMLIKKGAKIKILYIGSAGNLGDSMKKDWIIVKEKLEIDEFYDTLAGADLVFQHQGLGTLAQAISANIPTIANVQDIKDEKYPRHSHAWEVGPFAKLGMCTLFFKSTQANVISEEIEKLLYDENRIKEMKGSQKENFVSGEKNAYASIKKMLNNRQK